MAINFASTSGREGGAVTVNVTALTASTTYVATLSEPTGHNRRVEFTTDGTGAASFTFVPQLGARGVHAISVVPKNPTPTATSSNTFTGV